MMGTQPSRRQPALFAYHIDLEHRVPPDHLLRRVATVLDLSFVLPTVQPLYGRCGNVSLDPRVILKMMLLLFLYNVPSERQLMEQIRVRLDFLWFLGFDLDTDIPDHSVLSKARAKWGEEVFEKFFVRMVQQCVAAGLVNGSLLHVDSTIVKASASKDSVVTTSPELVDALRQAYQQQRSKLAVLPAQAPDKPTLPETPCRTPETQAAFPASVPAAQSSPALPMAQTKPAAPSDAVVSTTAPDPAKPLTGRAAQAPANADAPSASPSASPSLRVLPPASVLLPQAAESPKASGKKLPVNSTHISTTDPEAQLARNKSGVTELNYKEHRLVDDAHGVVTALAATHSNVPDGSQLPGLYEQHVLSTGLQLAQVTIAGDHHYGTAPNYIYCAQQQVRAHLADANPHLEERGKLPLSQFVYEPERDRLRCPQGHYLILHQDRPREQAKVYLIEDPSLCARCALREQCTASKRGRSIQRHVQAALVEAARAEASSWAAGYSRKRRRHVMEGSFADAFNNHGAKKARWRGLARQRIQSWLIAAAQNLRVLLRNLVSGPKTAAAAMAAAAQASSFSRAAGQMAGIRVPLGWPDLFWAKTKLLATFRW
jgi:transposase